MNFRTFLRLGSTMTCIAAIAHAQAPTLNPTSKIYVADTEGDTEITTGKGIGVLSKKSVYKGEGTAIQTKADSNASVVLSNGTGIYFDVKSRTEVRGFVQAPFRPDRTDMEEEPSISRTHVFIDYGVLAVSTSKMAAGSSMLLETSLATLDLHGRQAVIQAGDDMTTVSVFLGSATVQAGTGAPTYEVKAGFQATIRPGRPGQPNIVEVHEVPDGSVDGQRTWLYDRILVADAARKLVYFEMQAVDNSSVTLFDGEVPGGQQIVVVPVVPVIPPVSPTVSAANLSGL